VMPKLLPVLLAIAVFLTAVYFSLPFSREIVYKLGIDNDPTTSCCQEEEILQASGEFDEEANLAIFNNQIIDYPKTSLAQSLLIPSYAKTDVLGTKNEAGEDKWIEVSLREQKLRAWEGSRIVREFLISSGKWAPTPEGDYAIWYKTRNQTMKGGSKELGTYYYLPNVPYNMFFYKGYAVHGAYWHNNFGQPMSHGCVNSPISEVAWVFDWSGPVVPPGKNYVKASAENPGTRVFIH